MKLKLQSVRKTVASTGTPEAIMPKSTPTNFCKIKAITGNTGVCFIGNSAGQEYELAPGAELSLTDMKAGFDTVDLHEIYVRVGTNGNGVVVIYG